MSWKDFDLAPRVVSGPPEYGWRTDNPVDAAPVHVSGALVGYLATSVDASENVLKLYTRLADSDYFNNGSRFWREQIADAGAKRIPAHDTFRALLGTEGPGGSGRISTQTERFDSTNALVEFLNPGHRRAPSRGERGGETGGEPSVLPSSVRPSAPTRDEIDAVLRGQARPTPEIEARITALDEATHKRPAPEDVVVALAYDPATLPGGGTVGTIVHEPTFLMSTFLTRETRISAPVRLLLRVTTGTPALYTPPQPGEGGAGVLLLGRGIDWEITSVAPGEIQGTVVGVRP